LFFWVTAADVYVTVLSLRDLAVLQLRKSYPLKSLHDMRLSSAGRQSGRSEAALLSQGGDAAALRRQQVRGGVQHQLAD
jgi:hypothetical protein